MQQLLADSPNTFNLGEIKCNHKWTRETKISFGITLLCILATLACVGLSLWQFTKSGKTENTLSVAETEKGQEVAKETTKSVKPQVITLILVVFALVFTVGSLASISTFAHFFRTTYEPCSGVIKPSSTFKSSSGPPQY